MSLFPRRLELKIGGDVPTLQDRTRSTSLPVSGGETGPAWGGVYPIARTKKTAGVAPGGILGNDGYEVTASEVKFTGS